MPYDVMNNYDSTSKKWLLTGEDNENNPFIFKFNYPEAPIEIYKYLSHSIKISNLTLREVSE